MVLPLLYCIKFAYLETHLLLSSTHSADRGPDAQAQGEYSWDGDVMGQAGCVPWASSLIVCSQHWAEVGAH